MSNESVPDPTTDQFPWNPTIKLLKKLLMEAPRLHPTDAPALKCSIVIDGFAQPIEGALSETEFGGLRMLSVINQPQPQPQKLQEPRILELFFDYHSVKLFTQERSVEIERSRLITPGVSGQSVS